MHYFYQIQKIQKVNLYNIQSSIFSKFDFIGGDRTFPVLLNSYKHCSAQTDVDRSFLPKTVPDRIFSQPYFKNSKLKLSSAHHLHLHCIVLITELFWVQVRGAETQIIFLVF